MDMKDLMKQAQDMQSKLQGAQQELSKLSVTGEAGGGLVKLTMTGRHDVTSMHIDPSIFDDEDVETLEDLVLATINDAVRKVEKKSQELMKELTTGMNLPEGMGGLPTGGDE